MVSVRRVQQVLQAEPTLAWEKMPIAPALTACHRRESLEWAREMVKKGGLWRSHLQR